MLIDTELVAITILLIIFLLASTLAWRSAPELSGDSLDRYTRGETAKLENIAGRRIFRIWLMDAAIIDLRGGC